MDLGLKNKYALITGGSHGIGLAIASALADEGCHIAICARNKERLDKVAAAIKQKGVEVIVGQVDVMIPEQIKVFCNHVMDKWGRLDILVNNVGGGGRWGTPSIEHTEEKVWHDVYDKNAMAAVRFIRFFLPVMRKQKWGRMVTISSLSGREGGGRPWFHMAKSAEITLMKSLAMTKELARDGITFNTVAPGAIMIPETGWEIEKKKNPDEYARFLDQLPMGRLGTPDEVADLVAFICSEKASYLNGACLLIDGSESRSF